MIKLIKKVFIKSDMVQPLGTRDNILFDTAWNKSAKLGDLENDNLVVPDVADGLCSGILDKGPIEKSLKPWLHGNPMPIAGVVIAATGERLSIKSGIYGQESIDLESRLWMKHSVDPL